MITVVSGRLGSGKSFDVTRLVVRHLSAGGAVRTNMHLNREAIEHACNRRLHAYQFGLVDADTNPTEIPRGDFRGRGRRRTMVVLDEALNWFDSGTSKDSPLKLSWGRWLRQSDKLGQDVFFIAQNFERAAKWIRELAQVNREVVALKYVKLFGFFPIAFLIPRGNSLYLVQCYDVRSGTRIGTEFHYYDSRIFSCYDTSETYGFRASCSAYDGSIVPQFRIPSFWFLSFAFFLISLLLCAYSIFSV